MLLPTSRSEKERSLNKQVMMIYGRAGVGKSTFCSYFEDSLFFATEPGLNHLEVFKVPINSWETFLEACGVVAAGQHKFKTIIVDTIDNLIIYCSDYICRENKIEHPGDMPHGKGWAMVTYEMNRALTKLYGIGYGVILVSHSKQEEIETKTRKYNRFTIDVGGKNQNIILKAMEIILFMDSEMREGVEIGVIRTKPSLYWEAKDKSTLLPSEIPYPLNNPKVAFDIVYKAFNKTQTSSETKKGEQK